MSIRFSMPLDYQLQTGWLEPYVEGLQRGIAIGRCCDHCHRITFPPVRVCTCTTTSGQWVQLSGLADIIHRCDGADGSFALAQFEGVHTLSVVRLQSMDKNTTEGMLKASGPDTPALIVEPRQVVNTHA